MLLLNFKALLQFDPIKNLQFFILVYKKNPFLRTKVTLAFRSKSVFGFTLVLVCLFYNLLAGTKSNILLFYLGKLVLLC